MRVLCAGDDFITPEMFVDALAQHLDAEFVTHASRWPSQPWQETGEVTEAAGDEDEIVTSVRDIDLLVTHLAPVTTRVLENANRLRLVATPRGGPTNVNVAAATHHGVVVANLPGRNARAVAEFTVGLLIAGQRGIARSHARMRQGEWTGDLYQYDEAGPELASRTVGLVGLGRIGMLVADLLRGFGVRLLAWDPYVNPASATEHGVALVDFDQVLARSDIVSLHPRLTYETRRMIDRGALYRMKPGAYLVNTARGELIDEGALAEALRSGHLSGAALDTYDPEPPSPENPLLAMSQVVTVSHLAGASKDVARRASCRIAAEVGRFVRGEPLEHCLNPDVLRSGRA